MSVRLCNCLSKHLHEWKCLSKTSDGYEITWADGSVTVCPDIDGAIKALNERNKDER